MPSRKKISRALWEWRIDRRSEAGGGEEEEEDMGREEWRGLSGIIREREEGVRKEPTESGSMGPDQEASERMGRQLFSADGVDMVRAEYCPLQDTTRGAGCTSGVCTHTRPHPGLCMGRVVDRACAVILDGRFSGPGSVSNIEAPP